MQTAVAPELSPDAAHALRRDARHPTVDVVIPVLNEAATIEQSVLRVREYLAATTTFCGRVIIADNGSTDGTLAVAAALGDAFADVSVLHLGERGRGLALRSAWLRSTADVVAYMDVDLSTDLGALEPLVTLVTWAAPTSPLGAGWSAGHGSAGAHAAR
jgi:glycosyltransferase involved in cell wall biosynthesis